MTTPIFAENLLWIDLESSALPDKGDFSNVDIIEFACILTDMSLNKVEGYSESIQMTREIADKIKANEDILKMHTSSGLLNDCVKSKMTVEDVESEVLSLLQDNNISPQKVAIAGSGVAAFDFPLIKEKMPKLAEYLVYYPYDVGIFRRVFKLLSPRDVVNPSSFKYGSSKAHRAMDDIQDHLAEAVAYRDALGKLIAPF